MTEHTDDVHGRMLEMREQRDAWFARKKREAEEKEREQKRSELEHHLRRRTQEWRDYTDTEPGIEELGDWRKEFMAERAAERDLERELRLAEAEELYP
jgi:hypothetical protein